jgi:two-component system CheB/CheR fusion protein
MTTADADRDFDALLDYLKRSRGFDFTGYKRPSLMRRIKKRMEMVSINEFGDYEDYLEVHPDEFTRLFDMILINVTGFFRDSNSWDILLMRFSPRCWQPRKIMSQFVFGAQDVPLVRKLILLLWCWRKHLV